MEAKEFQEAQSGDSNFGGDRIHTSTLRNLDEDVRRHLFVLKLQTLTTHPKTKSNPIQLDNEC